MYGSVEKPSKETDPIQPSSPYAASKVAFDLYLLSISKFLNFPMNIIRPSNAYCSGQLLHRIIPKTIVSGLIGKKIPLQGGGRAEKSYIHARDLGRAIYLVSEKAPLGKIYNVGPKNPISIKDVVQLCAKALGKNFDEICDIAPDRLGQDSKYWLNSNSIFEDTGWKQEIFWDEGLKEVIDWAKKNLDILKNYSMDYIFRA
jgi:dTDP-glucose 4,6-dehydratase